MALTPRLLKTNTLTIKRKTAEGSYDANGDWIEGVTEDLIVLGSLQPFKMGTSKVELPNGVTAKDVRIFYTKTPLISGDEYTKIESDETTIEGIEYACWNVENWSTHNLNSDNYKTYFIRKDKLNA